MATVSGSRALVVDDDEVVRLSLARIMRKAGYLVAFVSTARAAIAQVCTAAPDIVFTDMATPGSDGIELLNWLRRRDGTIPLVAMSRTNSMLTGQLDLASKLGARATLAKPFLEQDVLTAIAAAVGGQRSPWPGQRWG